MGGPTGTTSLMIAPTTPLLRHEVGCVLLPTSSPSSVVGSGRLSKTAKEVVKLLKKAGFEVEVYDSQYKHKFLVAVIFLSKSMLRKLATELGLPIIANKRALREIIIGFQRTDRESSSDHVIFHDDGFYDNSLERVFLPYDERLDSDFHLYNKGGVPGGVGALVECNRQVVAENVLEVHLNMSLLKGGGVVIDCFPPHDEKKQIKLWYYYTNSLWFFSPLVDLHATSQIRALRDYVGKGTALFVVFGQCIAYVHLPILVTGIILHLFSPRSEDGSWLTLGNSIFGLIMPMLGVVSLRVWERKESQIACEWGCHSPAALALSLPLSHSPFIRTHNSGADTIVDAFDLPPASTLPLLAAERSWWTEKVLLSFSGTTACSEGQDVTHDVLWPVPLKNTLILPPAIRSRLLLVRAFLTTLIVLAVPQITLAPLLYMLRLVVSGLAHNMVDAETMTFLLPLLVHAGVYMALSAPAMRLIHEVTRREEWRTHRQLSRRLLERELGFKLSVWAGPPVWALLQQYTEGGCRTHQGSCAAAAGATATTVLVLHSIVEIVLLFVLPALRVRKRADILRLNERQAKDIRMPSPGAVPDDTWDGGKRQGQRRSQSKHWRNFTEDGNDSDGDKIPPSSRIHNPSGKEVAAAAEDEFLTLSSAFRADRDMDDLSHLSACYPQLMGTLVRWTMTWTFFGLAPWTLAITTLHSTLDLFLVAYQHVFNHRRSFAPATQLLAINPDAMRAARVLAVAATLASAALFTVYVDGEHGASALVLAVTPSSSTASSLAVTHSGVVAFFLFSWLLAALLLAMEAWLPPVPDNVIIASLRNEHIWRDLQSKLFFQAKGGGLFPGPGIREPPLAGAGAGAEAGTMEQNERHRDFKLQSLSSSYSTPRGSYPHRGRVSLARREDDFGRPLRDSSHAILVDPRIAEALLADRADELQQEKELYRSSVGEGVQSPETSQGQSQGQGLSVGGSDVENGGESPSSQGSHSTKSAGFSMSLGRKRTTSATVYEELQESDSDEN